MAELLACPFCRELYTHGEHETCPDCGVALAPLRALPPSLDAQLEAAERGEPYDPDEQRFAWHFVGAGRGALLACSVAGLALFFAPWMVMDKPESIVMSGFDFAHRQGWLWGGAVGWFVLIALTLTRRSRAALRGVRVISTTFASMTALEALMLLALPPHSTRLNVVEISWAWGLLGSLGISVVGVFVAARLGGKPLQPAKVRVQSPVRTSQGQTLH